MTGLAADSPPQAASRPFLAIEELEKSFGETRALRGCSFSVDTGSVHAIIGENGSGKSTLVKILAGAITPDAGRLTIAGDTRTAIISPRAARGLGIGTVFQEVLVIEELTLVENLFLGHDGAFVRRMATAEKRRRAEALLAELVVEMPSLDAPVRSIDLGLRQIIVIARALLMEPRLLILDEATAALDIAARDRVFAAVRRRAQFGMATLFITHKMDEIRLLAEQVTILRSGESVATLIAAEATPARMLELMSGRMVEGTPRGSRSGSPGAAVLTGEGLTLAAGAAPFGLAVRAGEILGLAGLEGQGQDACAKALAGLAAPASGMVLRAEGGALLRRADFTGAGVAYVPRERKREGIFAPLSIADNFAVSTLSRYLRMGLLSDRALAAGRARHLDGLKVKFGRLADPVSTLSGGNQQKVVIARALALEPRVLVLNDPTRGVDQATKQDIYSLLRTLAASGAAVVLLSTEIEELLALADRVAVFRGATLSSLHDSDGLDRSRLIAAMFGEAR